MLYAVYDIILSTRSLGGPPGPDFLVAALRACLTPLIALFWRSGRVTHTEFLKALENPIVLALAVFE